MTDYFELKRYFDEHQARIRRECESRGDRAIRIGNKVCAVFAWAMILATIIYLIIPMIAKVAA